MSKKKRFSRLKFNVSEFGKGDSLEKKFPGLFKRKEIKEFKHKHRDDVLKYVIYCYDPGSDLVDEFQNLDERKDAAATECGFARLKNGDWPSWLQKIMSLEDESIVPVILAYLQEVKNDIWREICTLEFEIQQYTDVRWQPIPDESKKDSSEILRWRNEIGKYCAEKIDLKESLIKRFYENNRDLQEQTKDEIVPIRPENVHKTLKMKLDAA